MNLWAYIRTLEIMSGVLVSITLGYHVTFFIEMTVNFLVDIIDFLILFRLCFQGCLHNTKLKTRGSLTKHARQSLLRNFKTLNNRDFWIFSGLFIFKWPLICPQCLPSLIDWITRKSARRIEAEAANNNSILCRNNEAKYWGGMFEDDVCSTNGALNSVSIYCTVIDPGEVHGQTIPTVLPPKEQ